MRGQVEGGSLCRDCRGTISARRAGRLAAGRGDTLRPGLSLPPEHGEAKAAQAEAEALRRLLLEGDAMRRAAAWLDAHTQLGREVFGRGVSVGAQAPARMADIADLFRA